MGGIRVANHRQRTCQGGQEGRQGFQAANTGVRQVCHRVHDVPASRLHAGSRSGLGSIEMAGGAGLQAVQVDSATGEPTQARRCECQGAAVRKAVHSTADGKTDCACQHRFPQGIRLTHPAARAADDGNSSSPTIRSSEQLNRAFPWRKSLQTGRQTPLVSRNRYAGGGHRLSDTFQVSGKPMNYKHVNAFGSPPPRLYVHRGKAHRDIQASLLIDGHDQRSFLSISYRFQSGIWMVIVALNNLA